MEFMDLTEEDRMELRRGEPNDLPFVYRSERRYMEELESDQLAGWYEGLERLLEQWVVGLPRTTIARLNGIRVGHLFWEPAGEKAVLASVNVDPSHRRRRIASLLMERFEEEARRAGCSRAELGFVSHNPARHLYEKLGYRPAGADGRYVLMTKCLQAP
ncbi:MAG: hypothetical protein COT28_12355 [Methylobacterium sp. CG08_land_8_20_14_0_20_71_15]|nr:MAG: hypothetical protein COT56_14640 [Methylobacterium sp. CG09_land_8_20_14_0_10_71_15]PIU13172.1 MAG: hypothetical protein COT28_12355 [Methylobacterium sp. CG08_land_8_20_14_0_20_71_15]